MWERKIETETGRQIQRERDSERERGREREDGMTDGRTKGVDIPSLLE